METAVTALSVFFSGHEKCQPRHFFGPAVRPQYLVHFVLSGKGLFRSEGQVYHLTGNSIFLIRPGQQTYYEADAQDPWEYCWVGFDGWDARQLMESCGLPANPVRENLPSTARSTFFKLCRAHIENRGNPIYCTGLLYQFFSYLAEPGSAAPAPGQYLQKAADYIRRNYMYDISVAGVSAYVGIDRSYLYRLFRQWQDTSPQAYLLRCRIEAAQRMLLESDYTVTEIAFSCGFRNISAFSKAFRAATGLSPSRFRNN